VTTMTQTQFAGTTPHRLPTEAWKGVDDFYAVYVPGYRA
jgi:hypothetical protein